MVKSKTRLKIGYFFTLFVFLLIGISGWAFYKIINQGIGDLLLKMGIVNTYLQSTIIIILAFIVLLLMGTGFFKALEKIIGKS